MHNMAEYRYTENSIEAQERPTQRGLAKHQQLAALEGRADGASSAGQKRSRGAASRRGRGRGEDESSSSPTSEFNSQLVVTIDKSRQSGRWRTKEQVRLRHFKLFSCSLGPALIPILEKLCSFRHDLWLVSLLVSGRA